MIGTLINAALVALNVGFYVAYHSPWNLASGVFCFCMMIACAIMEAS